MGIFKFFFSMTSHLPLLNLPSFDCKVTKTEDKVYIFDEIRKKNLVLTSEEWVRQHFVHLLVSHYHYSKNLLRLEGGFSYNKLAKRSDIVVYDTALQPFLLVECKAASVALNEDVIKQVVIYNKTLQCPYLCITNGMQTFCFSVDEKINALKQLTDLPPFR